MAAAGSVSGSRSGADRMPAKEAPIISASDTVTAICAGSSGRRGATRPARRAHLRAGAGLEGRWRTSSRVLGDAGSSGRARTRAGSLVAGRLTGARRPGGAPTVVPPVRRPLSKCTVGRTRRSSSIPTHPNCHSNDRIRPSLAVPIGTAATSRSKSRAENAPFAWRPSARW